MYDNNLSKKIATRSFIHRTDIIRFIGNYKMHSRIYAVELMLNSVKENGKMQILLHNIFPIAMTVISRKK